MTYTKQEIEEWEKHLVGKECPIHSNMKIKNGKFGLWCGTKTSFGWCNGGWPTEEFISNLRKE